MDNRLISLVKEHALEIARPGESFTLKSGAKSRFYLDCRNLNLTPKGLHEVVVRLWEIISPLKFDAVGGPSIGADPIVGGLTFFAGMTPLAQKLHGFLIRKEGKDHGKEGRIVGPLSVHDRCVIVEDVVTTGASSLEAIDVVHGFGAKVIQVVSVVDRLQGGGDAFASRGIPYRYLLSINDLGFNSDGSDFTS